MIPKEHSQHRQCRSWLLTHSGRKTTPGAVGVSTHTDMKTPILLLAACVPRGHSHSLALWGVVPYRLSMRGAVSKDDDDLPISQGSLVVQP